MRTLIIAIVALFVYGSAYGQTSPQISISAEKVKVNGEVMYVHKVKAKETLYSIAKAYDVTVDDIVRTNDTLKTGLKEGMTIYIPSTKAVAETSGKTATAQTNRNSSAPALQNHKEVSAGGNGIQGWKLSAKEIKRYSKKKHTVKWYEKLSDVAAKYNVPEDAIIAFNNLETAQLQKKQVLYIPNNEFLLLLKMNESSQPDDGNDNPETGVEIKQDENGTTIYEDSSPTNEDAVELKKLNIDLHSLNGLGSDSAKIGYILPLNLADTLGANSNYMDFYAGSLLAINSMKEEGMSLNVELVDQRGYSSIPELIAGKKVDESFNFIIGPVRSQDMTIFLKEFYDGGYTPYKWHKANIISPMDMASEHLVSDNEMFIQAPASQRAQIENLIKLFASKCTYENNAVVIYEKGGTDASLVKAVIDMLDTLGVKYSPVSYGILEGREILDKLMPHFKPQAENLVLVPSNSEAFVSDVVRNMNLLHTNPMEENRRAITLFGTARWRNFETIEVDYFHRMNLHLSLPYFIDYSNYNVKDFLLKYRALFNSEPTPFAFQGYDITRYFLTLHKKYGNSFNKSYELGATRMLQSKFNFRQNNNPQLNGFENTGTVDVVYNNDYTISVIE